MTRSSTWALALAATLLVACMAPAVVSAEEAGNPIILPEPTTTSPLKFTAVTEAFVKLENAGSLLLECSSGTITGEFTSKRLGTATMSFKGCAWNSMKCTSLGAELGTITFANVNLHLVALKVGEALRLGMVFKLTSTVSMNCWLGVQFRGSVIGLVDGPASSEKTKSLTLLFHKTSFKQELKECDLDKEFCFEGATHRKFLLESAFAAEFIEVGLERRDKVTLEKEAAFDF